MIPNEKQANGWQWLASALICISAIFQPRVVHAGAEALRSQPFVGRGVDGQLEVFRVGADGAVSHRWRKTENGEWSLWSNLGGSFLPGLAVGNNAAGQMEIFAVDKKTRELKYIRQLATNSFDLSVWKSLGGKFESPAAVGQNADGRLEVFAVDADTHGVKHLWQTNVTDDWSAWTDLGGTVEPGVVLARNKDGRLELLGVDAGGANLVHCWQLSTNTTAEWSPWSSLGGNITPGFAVSQNKFGRLQVFAVNRTNSVMERICELTAGDSTHWGQWTNFGPGIMPGIAGGQGGGGRLEIFAVSTADSTLLHRWELHPDDSDEWSAWASMMQTVAPYCAVAANEDTNLEVFAADPANVNVIHHRRQISYASDWLDWSDLDQPVFDYASRIWQVDEGLPDNLVQAITQTPDGYLWVGTRAGLARFDGIEFTTFEAKNTPAIKSSSITALCSSADGSLWIGTDGGGLVRLKSGEFTRFSKSDGLAGDNIRVIYQTRDGAIWIGTTSGLSRFKTGKFTNYSEKQKLLSPIVSYLCEDSEENLWIATGKGLNRLRHDGTMDAFAMPNGLPNDVVRGICQDKGGRIWIGSNNGLLWFNWFWGNSFYAYNTKYGLSDTFVSAICEDHRGNLWVGTYGGLNRFRDGRFYNQFNNEGLPFDKVNALFVDREGDLWVGSKEGLVRLTPKRFFTYTRQQGLTHNNIMSVLQDHNDDVWIGTWGGGLNRLKDGKITSHATTRASTNTLYQDLILSLCEGHDGSLWVGADFDGGLTHLKDEKIIRYTPKEGLINADLRVMRQDKSGNLWLGTSRGLGCFKNGKFVTNLITQQLAGESIREICEDHAGALWFGTQTGLVCWRDGKSSQFKTKDGLSDNTVLAIYEDGEHTLWLGTGGGGLDRLRSGHFTSYSTAQGMFSDEIFEILEDDGGCLWMSCSKGIFRVRKQEFDELDNGKIQTLSGLVFGKADGMESPQCNGAAKPAGWKTRDGRLWFPTSKGLVRVDPAAIAKDNVPPAVYLESVMADQKNVFDNSPGKEPRRGRLLGLFSTFRSSPSPLRIPPGRGELEFHYTALNLAAPEKSRFQYRLSNVDSGWTDAGARRVAYYNNLLPGTYEFQVKACNKDGVWSGEGASLAVVLEPHYWERIWVRCLAIIVLVGGGGGLVMYGTRRRMRRKFELLEQQQAVEKERMRIARDMHDQIGAGLTQIGLLGEFARRDAHKKNNDGERHAEKICDAARELAQTLDEIVWMVNPRNDTLNKLGVYLAAYAEEFFQASTIRCRLDIPPGLPALPLSTELRHNLFLVVKEALNNVVKYSGAHEARIRLALDGDWLEIDIEDNGVGFSTADATASGNGLSNMRERTEEVAGDFKIESGAGTGTRICLRIPMKSGSVRGERPMPK